MLTQQAAYTVLSEKDINQRQEEAVQSVATVLDISPTQAGILLRNYKWYYYFRILVEFIIVITKWATVTSAQFLNVINGDLSLWIEAL